MPSAAIVDGKMGSTVGKWPPEEEHQHSGEPEPARRRRGAGKAAKASGSRMEWAVSRGGCLRELHYPVAPLGSTPCAPSPFLQRVARLAPFHPSEVDWDWGESNRACDHSIRSHTNSPDFQPDTARAGGG
eukprot:6212263-Pleurochrysis_carterae.AAC.2